MGDLPDDSNSHFYLFLFVDMHPIKGQVEVAERKNDIILPPNNYQLLILYFSKTEACFTTKNNIVESTKVQKGKNNKYPDAYNKFSKFHTEEKASTVEVLTW